MKKTISYRVVSGTLRLSGKKTISGEGETNDPKLITELEELAQVTTGLGMPAYVVIRELGVTAEPDSKPSEPTLIVPDGVTEKQVEQTAAILTAQGLTWESANLLSDADLLPREDIGSGRIKTIRAIGKANGYPEFVPSPE